MSLQSGGLDFYNIIARMKSVHCRAITTGLMAYRELSEPQDLIVMGITSKGVFLKTQKGRVLFITKEMFHNPLSINVVGDNNLFNGISMGSKILHAGDMLEVNDSGTWLSIKDVECNPMGDVAVPWNGDIEDVKGRLVRISKRVYQQMHSQGLCSLLPELAGFEGDPVTSGDRRILDNIQTIINTIMRQDDQASVRVIESLLGLGRGLTPSGDDFIVGLFLTLARWGESLGGKLPEEISNRIITSAYLKTTLVSANLIEAAASGQADERLIKVLDGVMAGFPDIENTIANLVTYGNSSGVDSLTGISAALGILLK